LYQYLLIGKFILRRLLLRSSKKKILSKKNIIVSYLAYIDKKKLDKGIVKTIYWGDVFKNKKNNFFLFIYNENIKNEIKKICQIQKNKDSNFLILDTILNVKDFLLITFCWIKIAIFFHNKKKFLRNNFNSLNKSYKLFYEDIYKSLFGFDCFINIYYSYLFNKISKQKFFSEKIFYTHENQGWEKSLNFFLKSKTKKIYAVINIPVRYWDTRYFEENNLFLEKDRKKYLPDFYLVNGKISKNILLKNNFNKKKITQVEAVRYTFKDKFLNHSKIKKNFLVAGDSNLDVNIKLENIVIKLSKIFKKEIFYIKQHPNFKFGDKLRKIKNCSFVDDKSISELSNFCGKAIIPNMTSASIDAIMNDLKTLIFYHDGLINFSPLKDIDGILHENDEKMIVNFFKNKFRKKINKNYFLNLNLNNARWKKII
jgi:surface carbohydrate biosynthesis protein (TIGR04326 family)